MLFYLRREEKKEKKMREKYKVVPVGKKEKKSLIL